MSAHTKTRPIKAMEYIDIVVNSPSERAVSYRIPRSSKAKLDAFLKKLDMSKESVECWNEATPWEDLAKDRIQKYKKAGLTLRGARYRENMSQVELAQKSGVHQNEISKIENGKRVVGEKVAKRLAKVLNFDYRLLLDVA